MTSTVAPMRANTPVNMDIEQLRGWATFMDRAMIVSLVVTVIAVAALGVTTWQSFRFGGAVRAHEQAALQRDKLETDKHLAELRQDVAVAWERTRQLEQAAAAADQRATQAARESVAAAEKARTAEIDAEEVRKRVAELGKAVREATIRPPEPAPTPRVPSAPTSSGTAPPAAASPVPAPAVPAPVALPLATEPPALAREEFVPKEASPAREVAPPVAATSPPKEENPLPQSPSAAREEPPSLIVAALRKYAGTKAAVYVLDEAPDAPAIGATISGYLSDAGWAPLTWTWTGVGGIVGVVVLIKDGSDRVTDDAASAAMEALRTAGFNVAKGNWPADWRRFRGTLNGPQSPAPTDAPIRIVIGSKAR